jgi:hypothetical protein
MEVYFFGILVVLLVFSGATGSLGLLIYLGVPKRRPTDASNLNLSPPSNTQATVGKLIELGFRRLGETYTQMPLAMSPGPTWIFVDQNMTTQAEIVEITPGTFFTTVFEDGAVVETGFPQGEDITRVDFISQTVTTSVEDAYKLHSQNVVDFKLFHGAPQPIQTMSDYLVWDKIYRTRHAQRKMRRVFYSDLTQVLALAYGIIVSLAVWQLSLHHAPVPEWVTDWDRGLFLLLSPAFFVSVLSILIGLLGSRRNRKLARAAQIKST